MTTAHCKSCQALVIWCVTKNGNRMPVDAAPVFVPRGFRLHEVGADVVVATYTAAPRRGERLWVSHFATCRDAAAFRRPA